VGAIDERFAAGIVTLSELQAVGLVPRKYAKVKVLGEGEVTKKFVIKADAFSASAKEKIEKAGGKIEVLGGETAAA
jgi:large subunit ribosomal protein L15